MMTAPPPPKTPIPQAELLRHGAPQGSALHKAATSLVVGLASGLGVQLKDNMAAFLEAQLGSAGGTQQFVLDRTAAFVHDTLVEPVSAALRGFIAPAVAGLRAHAEALQGVVSSRLWHALYQSLVAIQRSVRPPVKKAVRLALANLPRDVAVVPPGTLDPLKADAEGWITEAMAAARAAARQAVQAALGALWGGAPASLAPAEMDLIERIVERRVDARMAQAAAQAPTLAARSMDRVLACMSGLLHGPALAELGAELAELVLGAVPQALTSLLDLVSGLVTQVGPKLLDGLGEMVDALVELVEAGPQLLKEAVRQLVASVTRIVEGAVAAPAQATIEDLAGALLANPTGFAEAARSAVMTLQTEAFASVRAGINKTAEVARALVTETIGNATQQVLRASPSLVAAVQELQQLLWGRTNDTSAGLMERLAGEGTRALYDRIASRFENVSACALSPVAAALDEAWDGGRLAAEVREELQAHFPCLSATVLQAVAREAATAVAAGRLTVDVRLGAADWAGRAIGAVRQLDATHAPEYVRRVVEHVRPEVSRVLYDEVRPAVWAAIDDMGGGGLRENIRKLSAGNMTEGELWAFTEDIALFLEAAFPAFLDGLLKSGAGRGAEGPVSGVAHDVGRAVADGLQALTGVSTEKVQKDAGAAVQDGVIGPAQSVVDSVVGALNDVLAPLHAGLLAVFDDLCGLGAAAIVPVLRAAGNLPNPVTMIRGVLEPPAMALTQALQAAVDSTAVLLQAADAVDEADALLTTVEEAFHWAQDTTNEVLGPKPRSRPRSLTG